MDPAPDSICVMLRGRIRGSGETSSRLMLLYSLLNWLDVLALGAANSCSAMRVLRPPCVIKLRWPMAAFRLVAHGSQRGAKVGGRKKQGQDNDRTTDRAPFRPPCGGCFLLRVKPGHRRNHFRRDTAADRALAGRDRGGPDGATRTWRSARVRQLKPPCL